MPDGKKVEGEAWFRVADDDRRIEWGSEGRTDYHGHLEVRPADGASEVEVHLHTERVGDGDGQIEDGLRETLAHIKQQLEGGG